MCQFVGGRQVQVKGEILSQRINSSRILRHHGLLSNLTCDVNLLHHPHRAILALLFDWMTRINNERLTSDKQTRDENKETRRLCDIALM